MKACIDQRTRDSLAYGFEQVEVKARSIMKSTKFIARLLGLLIQLDLANLAAIYAPVTRSMPAIKMDFHSVDSRRFNRPDSRPVIVPI